MGSECLRPRRERRRVAIGLGVERAELVEQLLAGGGVEPGSVRELALQFVTGALKHEVRAPAPPVSVDTAPACSCSDRTRNPDAVCRASSWTECTRSVTDGTDARPASTPTTRPTAERGDHEHDRLPAAAGGRDVEGHQVTLFR